MPDGADVVITGLGLVLPHGVGLDAADPVFAGRSAVRRLPEMAGLSDATGAPLGRFVPPKGTEEADRAVQFAVAAVEEAWNGAMWSKRGPAPDRVATIISLSKGGILSLCQAARHPADLPPWPARAGADAATRTVAHRWRFTGPMGVPVTACASGGHALVWGARMIRRGAADVAIVGAAEASLHPLILGSYRRMGVLAAGGDDPASSVRPFSATRRGFAIGEGAGILILESAAGAACRGARPVADVAAWATGCEALSLTDTDPTGQTQSHLITEALRRARLEPAAVDYVHAHGTATLSNDLAESRAIRSALGRAAAGVSVSSTKASHGHLLGAATAVELVLTVLAIQRGLVPPTANLTDPDPDVELDCTPLRARRRNIRWAVKIASGFGGQALAIVLKKTGGTDA